jgi:hypothetical protein
MTASPYSTLPRRMGSSGDGVNRSPAPSPFTLPNPVATPIMEMVEGSNFCTIRGASSLGRNSSLNVATNSEQTKNEVSLRRAGQNGLGICVRTPQLINDDRESCVWKHVCHNFLGSEQNHVQKKLLCAEKQMWNLCKTILELFNVVNSIEIYLGDVSKDTLQFVILPLFCKKETGEKFTKVKTYQIICQEHFSMFDAQPLTGPKLYVCSLCAFQWSPQKSENEKTLCSEILWNVYQQKVILSWKLRLLQKNIAWGICTYYLNNWDNPILPNGWFYNLLLQLRLGKSSLEYETTSSSSELLKFFWTDIWIKLELSGLNAKLEMSLWYWILKARLKMSTIKVYF